jgi:hypothetical protein
MRRALLVGWRIVADRSGDFMPPGRETGQGQTSLANMPIDTTLSLLEQSFLVSLLLTTASQLYIARRLRRR